MKYMQAQYHGDAHSTKPEAKHTKIDISSAHSDGATHLAKANCKTTNKAKAYTYEIVLPNKLSSEVPVCLTQIHSLLKFHRDTMGAAHPLTYGNTVRSVTSMHGAANTQR